MKKLCEVPCDMVHVKGNISVVQWEHGDPFPMLGPSVGVDTETERFTDVVKDPPIVVLGVFDPKSMTCYVVYWYDAAEFMHQLCIRDIEQRYFNLGYDEPVLSNVLEDWSLLNAIDSNKVFDMSIRQKLYDIEKIGFTRKSLNTLKACTKYYEHWELDKGDGSDTSARLSFKRYNEDGTRYVITDEQAAYLPYDCVATWALGEAIPRLANDPRTGVPFEIAHVKGMVVLAHITINGFGVDMKIWEALESKLKAAMDKYRDELLLYGFPDPYKDEQLEQYRVKRNFHDQYTRLLKMFGLESEISIPSEKGEYEMPSKVALRNAIHWMWEHEPDEARVLAEDLKCILEDPKPKMRAAEKRVWDEICEDYELASVDASGRAIAMQAYVGAMLESICNQLDVSDKATYHFKDAVAFADELVDQHPDWLAKKEAVKPQTFFQNHVKELISSHPGLELDVTPKSGAVKLTKDDMWRLTDMQIEDKFLESYINFKHSQKLFSTYLNRKYICGDGKIRAYYTNIRKTGRTSCSSPNLQNLPSREKHFPIKNAFIPPAGAVMCATDYSFVELVCLAQSCYTRFGRSVLRDVINADVDPHSWFAGVRDGLITGDTDFIHSQQKIDELKQFLKENISKEARQHAKMANFGFGGGMSAATFWRNCRKQGVVMTMDDAEELRKEWTSAFPEVKMHFNPEQASNKNAVRLGYGMDVEDDDDEELEQDDPGDRRLFVAHLINGMIRNNGSYCSILNIQFQGLAAYGLKLGLWNMAMAGFLPRMLNEVHDEANYWLMPDELKTYIPVAEDCMIRGMRVACPDVKVKVESTCMLHWDKNAVEFNKLEWDDQGRLIIEEPPFVQEVYGIKSSSEQE